MRDEGRAYVFAWLGLLVLTIVSFGFDQLRLGAVATAVALSIAIVKAGIVLAIFMHVRREPFPIRFVAFLNVAWIALLCFGIAADVAALEGLRAGQAP